MMAIVWCGYEDIKRMVTVVIYGTVFDDDGDDDSDDVVITMIPRG